MNRSRRSGSYKEVPADLEVLQQSLQYFFKDTQLLTMALTHRSSQHHNYERLEYLGDSILGFVIAEKLYHRFDTATEGELTHMRSRLVCATTLAMLAMDLHIGDYLLLGSGELKNAGLTKESILADAIEAIIGAVYLDSGMASTEKVVHTLFGHLLDKVNPEIIKDPKTTLQEILQKNGHTLPIYTVVSESGEAHDIWFTVTCTLPDIQQVFSGQGGNKKGAEQDAANHAIHAIENSSE